MTTLLLVMHARGIARVLASIEALEIDQAWMCGYTERQLEPVVAEVIETTDYDRYVMFSDDSIVSQHALNSVLAVHNSTGPRAVVTGWCQYAQDDARANLSIRPLTADSPRPECYSPPRAMQVWAGPPIFRSYFTGMALTCMSRDLWLRFPFASYGDGLGYASDYSLSWRLQEAGVPVIAVRDGYVEHIKEHWNVPDLRPECRVLVGEMTQEVRFRIGGSWG